MTDPEFDDLIRAVRPRLHRFCARMAGSAIDGEDVLQDALLKASSARSRGDQVVSFVPWLFRIAHNASLDFMRRRARQPHVPIDDNYPVEPAPAPEAIAFGFRAFLRLPDLQRCTVILKDVLGHSIDEIAAIAGCSPAAAKSALQRGRQALRRLAEHPEDHALPPLAADEWRRIDTFVRLFRAGDFDEIRAMLADDVRLDLVNRLRLDGKDRIAPYFSRYAEAGRWHYAPGVVEDRAAMLVFDASDLNRPAHFVLVAWQGGRIAGIRDFLFAPYAMESSDWGRFARIPEQTPSGRQRGGL
jgi:RNA polymerase sigma-70 factor (ECF subfamily)